ncbi:MAG: hypothetical protein IT235_04995 [Bacteroidia bacterium]|nr:hypothetical protein [Bacteroidia bacterium]
MAFTLNAQDIKVFAKLDSNSIRIGEQTKIHLSVNYKGHKGDVRVQWPAFSDTLINKVEIVSVSKIDTTIPNKNDLLSLTQTQAITITSFDSGFYAIPPFKFIVNGDTAHPYETEAILLQINNIPVDTTQAIKDIKPPLYEPFSWRELIPYAYWALGAIVAILAIYYTIKKLTKSKPKEKVKEKIKTPPHVIALQELEKLRNEKLWQQGMTKQYHSRITDILRLYIEKRFKIPAMEQTSDEIMIGFRSVLIDQESKTKLKQLFLLADLVKFAKEDPLPNENELNLTYAFDFVNGTLREEKELRTDDAGVISNTIDNIKKEN